ncbi:MAG TPA: ABC transporter permease subunit [Pseudomonadales bacterium]
MSRTATADAPKAQVARRRRVVNALTARVVALGGAAVIAAITLIFLYLLWVVVPVFRGADIDTGASYRLEPAEALLIEANDSEEIGLRISAAGEALFFDLADGRIRERVDLGRPIAQAKPVSDSGGLYALLDTDGNLGFVQASYPVSFRGEDREITPRLEFAFEESWIDVGPAELFDVWLSGRELLIAAVTGRTLTIHRFRNVEPDYALDLPRHGRVTLRRDFDHLHFGARGRWLYLVGANGALRVLDLARPTAPEDHYHGRLTPEGTAIRDVAPLLGRHSLLVADAAGGITQWFMVRSAFGERLEPVRRFETDAPVTRLIPEQRRKGFAAIDDGGRLHLFYSTSERHLATHRMTGTAVDAVSISPRADLLLTASADGHVQSYRLRNDHPEISWSTLWSKVWYEGYPEPVYSWQSSAASTDYEAKFSLTPLLFGTLKGAFYALFFAVPVAILGALYTAYFMAPAMRRLVKPGIEVMAALPTVVLGFLAGLWLAPLIEANLAAVLSVLVVMPALTMLFAWLWSRLPDRLTRRFDGWYALIAVPLIVLTIWIAFAIGPWLELTVFGGNTQTWIREHLGLDYDQRNALVVGLAMGLAVIPTIFSIAEDAVYGVPTHLINGSLALGATRWQTLTRVVVLTASPGIFSAVMIGLGRAVGETMIVLMATGNTPVMDMNIFEGMRTFAANIAVEMPESEVGSTHYRILFLTALVLFMLTFVFNTAAELVRQRLRKRYGNL